MVTGDIRNESRFGVDFRPDWDESPLADLRPSVNGRRKAFYTWRNDSLPFPPGALDRVLYTDSVLRSVVSVVLNCGELSADELAAAGLRADDSWFAGREGANYGGQLSFSAELRDLARGDCASGLFGWASLEPSGCRFKARADGLRLPRWVANNSTPISGNPLACQKPKGLLTGTTS